MSNQGTLFEVPAARREAAALWAKADPKTSRLAGEDLTASGVRRAQKRVVVELLGNLLRRTGWAGATSKELAAYWSLDRHMVARRLPDLERDGLVAKCGVRMAEGRAVGVLWRPVEQEKA